ncbi:TraB/GumN family protein [Paraburkholderia adhaesiva]|uniref:TraB/GumN family protein n=1 Tax=Paraburkholderia adhaesiva TaxID=2883244 RepID=UPI001F2BF1E7|nr:TraB/GumN family protein [Paraburkholderia adhaesiva]
MEDAATFYRIMIEERNRAWMTPLQRYLDQGNAVVLVGAGHLPSPAGLIRLLTLAGYRVEPTKLTPVRGSKATVVRVRQSKTGPMVRCMGEANRRGSREQRVVEAKERTMGSLSQMAEWVNLPVDENLYLFCSNLYSAAAHMSMPVENPESKELRIDGFGTVAFSDIPVNRGMLAVTNELNEQGVDQKTRFSTCWRIMHFGDVLGETERFAKWLRPGEEPGAIDVAEALIRACAIARIDMSNDKGSFDMDDVARHAAEIAVRLDAEDRVGPSSGA